MGNFYFFLWKLGEGAVLDTKSDHLQNSSKNHAHQWAVFYISCPILVLNLNPKWFATVFCFCFFAQGEKLYHWEAFLRYAAVPLGELVCSWENFQLDECFFLLLKN